MHGPLSFPLSVSLSIYIYIYADYIIMYVIVPYCNKIPLFLEFLTAYTYACIHTYIHECVTGCKVD